jgi:hypothetical protein
MKNVEVKLEDEGFEDVESGGKEPEPNPSAAAGSGTGSGANRPDIRIVQTDKDREGKSVYLNVGGMWKNISKNGKEFYVVRIGQLKLLAFPNDRK